MIIGRVTESKGQLIAVQAVRLLRDKGIGVKLDIYGAVDYEAYIKKIRKFISDNDLKNSVKIKGFAADMDKRLSEYDILCTASKKEGFGLLTIEAKLAGLLVVGSASGVARELIENGMTGLLYSYKDGPFGMAKQIEWAAGHREEARIIAKKGREDAAFKFSL
ncbi:MAG: glycosyltransferase family 4 protein [Clostridiales bacterium]|nr:glycosyltransferase family 4 protein [Clostridiales bacterium]MBS5877488.1 glycosyltransferase family 4 protein [Clostridiales bacterium]MDU0938875.1 glycosyltransferase family 4 protein [Clostridiales bacterium]MDU1041485.1 glycosyltransferase family 4 protein [Clostridiales bacterium]MDU3490298.1 glycosyltransferase family 4 protein [Clostridiales bacterium]